MHRFLKLNQEKLDLLIKLLHESHYETEQEQIIANELSEKFGSLCLDNYYNLGEGWDDEYEENDLDCLENFSITKNKDITKIRDINNDDDWPLGW